MEVAMLEKLERSLLESEVAALMAKLRDQGIEFPELTDEEIKNLDVKSLRDVARRLEKLARTPGGR
jgi:uncharacterized membrane protein